MSVGKKSKKLGFNPFQGFNLLKKIELFCRYSKAK